MANRLETRLAALENYRKTTLTSVMASMRRLPEGELSSFGEDSIYIVDSEEFSLQELEDSLQYIMLLPEKDNEL